MKAHKGIKNFINFVHYQNVRSISGKDKLKIFNENLLIQAKNYEVIVITESWLHDILNSELLLIM